MRSPICQVKIHHLERQFTNELSVHTYRSKKYSLPTIRKHKRRISLHPVRFSVLLQVTKSVKSIFLFVVRSFRLMQFRARVT